MSIDKLKFFRQIILSAFSFYVYVEQVWKMLDGKNLFLRCKIYVKNPQRACLSSFSAVFFTSWPMCLCR